MKRKLFLLTAIILTLSFFLTACGQGSVIEDTAKENAINALNKAFDASITDANLILMQHEEIYFENDQIKQNDPETWVEYYRVSVDDEQGGSLFYSEVDARTSAVTYVYQNADKIELTAEQEKQAKAIGTFAEYSANRFQQEQKDAASVAVRWVQDKMEPEGDVDHAVTKDIYTDQEMFPTLVFESIVVMKSGTAYDVNVVWPAMQVCQARIFQPVS
ncbi:MAG: hypothetical protein CVV04_10295 [Firmicutes bacterium HGW-Firmicutes-9]|jgi:predicted small secreted protein|nr:MAG: hypothetical protein CVV04_10295 [Firmicutes bacterium HGW-Firmicutes-9]